VDPKTLNPVRPERSAEQVLAACEDRLQAAVGALKAGKKFLPGWYQGHEHLPRLEWVWGWMHASGGPDIPSFPANVTTLLGYVEGLKAAIVWLRSHLGEENLGPATDGVEKPDNPEPPSPPAASSLAPPTSEQLGLKARIICFLTDRAEKLRRLPQFNEVRQAHSGEIGPASTFYRKNPWYKIVRAAISENLRQNSLPRGHRNAAEDGGGVDAEMEAPDYYCDEEG
jgi:hypothetical protein